MGIHIVSNISKEAFTTDLEQEFQETFANETEAFTTELEQEIPETFANEREYQETEAFTTESEEQYEAFTGFPSIKIPTIKIPGIPDIKIPTINVNKIVEDIKNAPPPPPIKLPPPITLPPPVTIPKPKPLGKLPGVPNILDKVKGFFSGYLTYFKYVGYVFIGLIVLFVLSKLAPILGFVFGLFRRG